MIKKFSMIILTILLIVSVVFLTGCSEPKNENTQSASSETVNQIEGNSINNMDTNNVIQVGDYTLEYGNYIDKYGTKYTLNNDGTYSCESKEFPNKSGTGTFEIFYFDDNTWDISEYGYPAGIDSGWYIGFNPDNNKKDSEKPWLFDNRYDVNENNVFYNAQTDEIWNLENEANNSGSEENRIYGVAEEGNNELTRLYVEETIRVGLTNIYTDYFMESLSNSSLKYSDYCTASVLKESLSDDSIIINSLTWTDEKGNGTITYENNNFNFTIENNTDVSVEYAN